MNKINPFPLLFLLISALALNPAAAFAAERPALNIEAKSACLMEPMSGRVLFEMNPTEKLPLASVTKVMTMLLIFDAIEAGKIKLDDTVTVSAHAAAMGGSQVFLEPNEKQSVKDMLKSVIIASANDASVSLAEFISGSEDAFVDAMNERAKNLNMQNTHFVNACGLDADNHYSCALDIAIMTRELMTKHPQVFDYSGIWMDSITHKTSKGESQFGLTNTNKLLKWYNGATGLKTGSTGKALFCMSATAKRDNMELISVVMGAQTPTLRFQEAMKMLDYGFANYQVVSSEEAGTEMGLVRVMKGEVEDIPAILRERVSTVLPKGNTVQMEKEVKLNPSVSAPAKRGDVVGEVTYSYGGQIVGKSKLILSQDIKKASLMEMLRRTTALFFE